RIDTTTGRTWQLTAVVKVRSNSACLEQSQNSYVFLLTIDGRILQAAACQQFPCCSGNPWHGGRGSWCAVPETHRNTNEKAQLTSADVTRFCCARRLFAGIALRSDD